MSERDLERPTLTGQAEDYLKAIYELERHGASAGTNDIASRLGIAPASVTGMVQRLARLGLATTERYKGARLTDAGRAAAIQLIRRHRIIESYLVQRLASPSKTCTTKPSDWSMRPATCWWSGWRRPLGIRPRTRTGPPSRHRRPKRNSAELASGGGLPGSQAVGEVLRKSQ